MLTLPLTHTHLVLFHRAQSCTVIVVVPGKVLGVIGWDQNLQHMQI